MGFTGGLACAESERLECGSAAMKIVGRTTGADVPDDCRLVGNAPKDDGANAE